MSSLFTRLENSRWTTFGSVWVWIGFSVAPIPTFTGDGLTFAQDVNIQPDVSVEAVSGDNLLFRDREDKIQRLDQEKIKTEFDSLTFTDLAKER